ncbi:MAG: transporter transrane protein [Acidimicrobiaceae bacterium]|jgi:ABC-type glycerol-3-phosphate transport system permease component|nr:transporter transrane protein [Acidimicrobiaceae bacterium]
MASASTPLSKAVALKAFGHKSAVGPRTVAVVAVVAVLFPLAWVIRVAARPTEAYVRNPNGIGGGFTLGNFASAWREGLLGPALLHTLYTVPLGAVLATVVAAFAGYGFAKLRVPFRRFLLGFVIMAIAIPIPSIIIPLFNEGLDIGYTNNYIGLSIVCAALYGSWGTFFLYGQYKGLPDALIDSAHMDGAHELGIFFRIAVPLVAPSIATVLALNFILQWSNILLQLVLLPTSTKQTMMVSVSALGGQYTSATPIVAAGYLEAAAPLLLIYALSQRFIRRGMFAGALNE